MQQYDQIVSLTDQISRTSVWQDDGVYKLYLYCLSQMKNYPYIWHEMLIQPDDIPIVERRVSKDLGWSRNKLDRKLKLLCDEDLIEIRSLGNRGTLLHVKKDKPEFSLVRDLQKQIWLQIRNIYGTLLYPSLLQSETRNGSDAMPAGVQHEAIEGFDTKPKLFQSEAMVGSDAMPAPFQSEAIEGSDMMPVPFQGEAMVGSKAQRTRPQFEAETPVVGSKTGHNSIYIKKNISSPSSIQEPEGFTRLWVAYPSSRRFARAEAAALVQKALNDGATIDVLLEALEADKQSDNWHQENGRFIPGIVKWLEKETWRSYLQPAEPEEDEEKWTTW